MDKLDILNRDKFVEQLVRLIENISDNKVPTCFAINGAWGSGKSFVLDMFEEKLSQIHSEETFNEKYFIVRYNCWKYDYYEEPLIAIVSAITDEIERKTALFPDSKEKQEIISMFKAAGVSLLSLANTAFKAQTGLDIQSAYETVIKGEKEGAEKYEKEHAYDTYLGLNKVIDKLAELLQEIAEQYTVVIIVDELDRCIPEYAIKVLERLHHLTDEKKNIITVVAVDKKQLLKSVEHIFGIDNPDKYLEKFINFEIKLDNGAVSEKITDKYADYIELFDKNLIPFPEPIDECVQAIFTDVDIRKQEQIMKKIMLVHKLLFADKKDYSFMCVELLVAVMMEVYDYKTLFSKHRQLSFSSFGEIFIPYANSQKPSFNDFFKEKFNNVNFSKSRELGGKSILYRLPDEVNIYAAILFIWYHMHIKSDDIFIQAPVGCGYEPIKEAPEEIKLFAETLRLIK